MINWINSWAKGNKKDKNTEKSNVEKKNEDLSVSDLINFLRHGIVYLLLPILFFILVSVNFLFSFKNIFLYLPVVVE